MIYESCLQISAPGIFMALEVPLIVSLGGTQRTYGFSGGSRLFRRVARGGGLRDIITCAPSTRAVTQTAPFEGFRML